MRAVLDANVIISALLFGSGPPADLVRAWQRGDLNIVMSPTLIAEIQRALEYPKLRRLARSESVRGALDRLIAGAELVEDATEPASIRCTDLADNYLIDLAARQEAALVSGDKHLLALRGQIPVYSPREFVNLLAAR